MIKRPNRPVKAAAGRSRGGEEVGEEVAGGQGFGVLAPDQWRPGGSS